MERTNFFFLGQKLIPFVREYFVIVHHLGNSAQISFSSTHTIFPNQCCTNASLTHANKDYTANLRGVIAKLRSQSCPRNQNTGSLLRGKKRVLWDFG
jgi:hypothetical protein